MGWPFKLFVTFECFLRFKLFFVFRREAESVVFITLNVFIYGAQTKAGNAFSGISARSGRKAIGGSTSKGNDVIEVSSEGPTTSKGKFICECAASAGLIIT